MASNAPVEGKVWAGTAGTGAGLILSTFILWVLGVTVWGAGVDSASAQQAVAAVPGPVTALIGGLVTLGFSLGGGYLAKHTPRPEDMAANTPVPEDSGYQSFPENEEEPVDLEPEPDDSGVPVREGDLVT